MAVDDQHVVLGLPATDFFAGDGAGELALRGVVLEEVGEVVRGHEIVDGDDIDGFAE